MDLSVETLLFAFLRSAIRGTDLTEEERNLLSPQRLSRVFSIAKEHDLEHLIALVCKKNLPFPIDEASCDSLLFKAVYRYEHLQAELEQICRILEEETIAFLPLKGAVIRKYYPEPWMRTSCDIDVLVHKEDFSSALSLLTEKYQYQNGGVGTHDATLLSSKGVHVELHFDLLEENRANHVSDLLSSVWQHCTLCKNSRFHYEMSDSFFYLYHLAHMAKHLEEGGCGIRSFLDLYLLDHLPERDEARREKLLSQGHLLSFQKAVQKLSRVWMEEEQTDDVSRRLHNFIVNGGAWGSTDNRVAIQQTNKGGRLGYLLSRVFIPFDRLKRYFPILEKHPWLAPLMQVRRWLMLFSPTVFKMAKSEISLNARMQKEHNDPVAQLIEDLGLDAGKKNEKMQE